MDNNELKKHLEKDSKLSIEIWDSFYQASIYGTATPMQWLISNLTILYKRVLAGDIIYVENKNFTIDKTSFKNIIETEFYDISLSDIEKEYKTFQ